MLWEQWEWTNTFVGWTGELSAEAHFKGKLPLQLVTYALWVHYYETQIWHYLIRATINYCFCLLPLGIWSSFSIVTTLHLLAFRSITFSPTRSSLVLQILSFRWSSLHHVNRGRHWSLHILRVWIDMNVNWNFTGAQRHKFKFFLSYLCPKSRLQNERNTFRHLIVFLFSEIHWRHIWDPMKT